MGRRMPVVGRSVWIAILALAGGSAVWLLPGTVAQEPTAQPVDATALRGRVMCGYQGWFRCPGDAARLGWVHWSRDAKRLTAEALSFEMWPDMAEYGADERFAAPGFSHPDGKPAQLFSSDNAATVLRHFRWMRDYGIDGAWLQHFVVDLPGGPAQARYPSRRRVLDHVREAARQTGRVWALSYDISGMPADRIFDVLSRDWKTLVDDRVIDDARYLRHGGKPVVQVWGFYRNQSATPMTPALAKRLIDFFRADGRYAAFLVGGGDWDWRNNPDRDWQQCLRRLGAYAPWNVGNYRKDGAGTVHAATDHWAGDRAECERHGVLWIPVVYPGFSWDNLQRKPAGTTSIPRRGGRFLWEQFHALAELKADTAFVAMFDEVDEGTAIFKVTSAPPTPGHFVGYEGLPSDWYLRLTGEGIRMLRGQRPLSADVPIKP
jgi:hypothetical protein